MGQHLLCGCAKAPLILRTARRGNHRKLMAYLDCTEHEPRDRVRCRGICPVSPAGLIAVVFTQCGRTPLMIGAAAGSFPVTYVCLRHGGSVHATDKVCLGGFLAIPLVPSHSGMFCSKGAPPSCTLLLEGILI